MPVVAVMMTKAEARESMDAVVSELQAGLSAIERAAVIVSEIEEREGYRALGHRSLAACLAAELHVTRRRAYQVLDEMRGRALLTEAAGESVPVTVRQAREIIRQPEVIAQVKQSVAGGIAPTIAYERALAEQRQVDAERAEQGRLVAVDPKLGGRKGSGYQTLAEQVRRWCEALEAVAEGMDDESPLDLDFSRALVRLRSVTRAILRDA